MAVKEKIGIVVSDKMDKTCIVVVQDRVNHKRYKKLIIKTKHYLVHDVLFDLAIGDKVLIQETIPLSKKKRWTVTQIF
jgi:small subunit ribosomal protein S17